MPFAAIGVGLAALVTAGLVMLKGGMIRLQPSGNAANPRGGASVGGGDELGDDMIDPFRRFPRARESDDAPAPTQTETVSLDNGPTDNAWAPEPTAISLSYTSPGDGGSDSYAAPYFPNQPALAGITPDTPTSQWINLAPPQGYIPPPPVFAPSPGGGRVVRAV